MQDLPQQATPIVQALKRQSLCAPPAQPARSCMDSGARSKDLHGPGHVSNKGGHGAFLTGLEPGGPSLSSGALSALSQWHGAGDWADGPGPCTPCKAAHAAHESHCADHTLHLTYSHGVELLNLGSYARDG
jgi:hypothetical protein